MVKWWTWYVYVPNNQDVTSEEIPEPSGSGRRASVRETTPHTSTGSTFHATPSSAHRATSPSETDSSSPVSTFPISPPPSPPLTSRCLREPEHTPSQRWAPAPMASTSIRSALQQSARFTVPGTPEVSPAQYDVHHHPKATAEAFLRRIFVDWHTSGALLQAEDAGIELVCRGWTGAVVQKCDLSYRASTAPSGVRCAKDRSLYVLMPRSCDRSQLHEHILRILETASHSVCAARVVVCLERDLPDLSSLIHGFCYVGGEVSSMNGQRDAWSLATPTASLVLVSIPL